jgi:NADH-quinone oxidoreductase subunit E
MESFDQSAIDLIIEKYGKREESLISILRDIQSQFGYLPKEALQYVSQKVDLPLSKIFCIATFYSSFSLEPRGKNLISVCQGTACHVKNGEQVVNKLAHELKLSAGEKTTADRAFSVEKVRCLGCCSMASAVRVNQDTYGQVTQNNVDKILKKYRKT